MKLLAIDTATEACSVALWLNGEIIEHYEVAVRGHAVRLPLMVPALLAEAGLNLSQIDCLVCGVGPGSFAGVRIGVSYVKGLALGLDRPVVGITSLAMLAQAALLEYPEHVALPAIDARMNEAYFGVYRLKNGLAVALQPDTVCATEFITVELDSTPYIAIGTGWQAYGPALESRLLPRKPIHMDGAALPHAKDALPIAVAAHTENRGTDAANLVPVYLRNRVALTKVEQVAQRAERDQAKYL